MITSTDIPRDLTVDRWLVLLSLFDLGSEDRHFLELLVLGKNAPLLLREATSIKFNVPPRIEQLLVQKQAPFRLVNAGGELGYYVVEVTEPRS